MSTLPPWILLLVAHGTVEREEELPEFLLEIRRGRAAPPELVEEMRARYRAIGGSPLLAETRRQADALGAALGCEARVAMRLWNPRVEVVLADLAAADRVCLVPLAPFSVFVYEAAARESLARLPHPPELRSIAPWGAHPALIAAWVEVTERVIPSDSPRCEVLLTAHSLPQRVVDAGDPYAQQFEQAARQVAAALPVPTEWAYQSQGAMAGAWLGPSLVDKLTEMAARGVRDVVVSPLGFLSEHVETLYDLDIEAKALCEQLGLRLHRAPALGTAPGLIAALAAGVRAVIAEPELATD